MKLLNYNYYTYCMHVLVYYILFVQNEDTLLWYNQTTPVSPSLHSKYLEPLVRRVQPSNIR